MKRKLLFLLPLLIIVYLLGPRPDKPLFSDQLPEIPIELNEIELFIEQKESQHNIKPGNAATIVWADSARSKTPYVIVYLHGFSASHREGAPVHTEVAEAIHANLYLPRLADHGIDTVDALYNFTADRIWESAKEALVVGSQLGDKVILMSTSTGGTLALMLAAAFPEKVYAMINFSPNIRINNPLAFLTNNPWGLQLTRISQGGKSNVIKYPEVRLPYWNENYRYEAIVQLQQLLESAMVEETFKSVTQPTLNLYYYKSEKEQDPVVKVDAMLWMHNKLATPDALKRAVAVPEAGDHVIACDLTSNDLPSVRAEVFDFIKGVLKISIREQNHVFNSVN